MQPSELSEIFGCCLQNIDYWLKKLRVTRKKTTLYAKRNEEKRQEFMSEIKKCESADLVYLDESRINKFLYRE